ncbi:hypothetical protein AB0I28_12325 [Phytomonospora sp. NPDC050363]|uniref:hypothetical protein n=1 Tax=Phytomonospora sp. NPDC050363 TaxID=3155642 RepID=UPI0033EEBB13
MTFTPKRTGDNRANQHPMHKCLLCADDKWHPGGLITIDRHMSAWHDLATYTVSDTDSTDGADAQLKSFASNALYMTRDGGPQ